MARSVAKVMVVIAATLVTTGALAAQRTYDRKLSAPPGGRLTFVTNVGSVAIVGRQTRQVVIHAELQGSEAFLARFHISAEQTPSRVTVSAHADRAWLRGLFETHQVRFIVEIPRDYPVDLRTSDGRLDVRDLKASLRAATSGGDVLIENIAGSVNVHTFGGDVEADHINGPAELSSSGGSIHVKDSTGDLDLSSAGGGIHMQNDDGKIHAVSSGGSIRAELPANRGISLTTDAGDITLLLPQNTRASIDAESGGGRVTCGFPLSAAKFVADNHLVGPIGGGGAAVSLYTSGGNIDVAPEK